MPVKKSQTRILEEFAMHLPQFHVSMCLKGTLKNSAFKEVANPTFRKRLLTAHTKSFNAHKHNT